jgi:hypothetical protein
MGHHQMMVFHVHRHQVLKRGITQQCPAAAAWRLSDWREKGGEKKRGGRRRVYCEQWDVYYWSHEAPKLVKLG